MSALSGAVIHDHHPRGGVRSYLVKDAQAIYAGGLVDVDGDGYLVPHSNTAGLRFVGIALQSVTGDTSASPKVECRVNISGPTLRGVAVASAVQGSLNEPVYSSTDNPADLVLTPTSLVGPVGKVVRYVSAGVADVELLEATDAPVGTGGIYSLSIPITLAQITGAGDVLTTLTVGHAFKILSFDAWVTTVVTTGSKAATLNIEIGTTNVTGGEIALTSANCTPLGAKVAGSAITAANVGTASDTISIEAASVTAFSEGAIVVAIRIQNLDGAAQ